jgi:hypothetical protein
MSLTTALPGLVPSAVVVVLWSLMWRAGRRRRLLSAALMTVLSAGFVLLGVYLAVEGNIVDRQPLPGCEAGQDCDSGWHLMTRPDSPVSMFGQWLAASALLALLISALLLIVTAVVEVSRVTRAECRPER